jgi:MFS family permease
MGDLVPEATRGVYFGKRNMVVSVAGMAATLGGGLFLAFWQQQTGTHNPYGFVCIFALGVGAGVASAWFLSRVADPDDTAMSKALFRFAMFLQPFRDPNFRLLMFMVAGWTFAIQLAAPFYSVFMIEQLRLSYPVMTLFTTVATLAMAFMMRTWGPLTDKFGNKPVILVASTVLILVPVIWLFALPQAYLLPLTVAHALSGAALAGATLSHFNISMKLSPQAGRSVYLAAYTAVTGLIGGTAPIICGYLSELLQGIQIALGGYQMTGLHTIFLLSAALQFLILPGFLKLQETGAASPVAIIIQLQNDLNPQSGISSALDVAMIELGRAEAILDNLDEATDAWAERSERKVAYLLDILSEPLKRIRDVWRHDD